MSKQVSVSEEENVEKTCFVIMPISDSIGYAQGHFKRVYDHLIKPACLEAGFTPIRADDIKGTNAIVIDILRRIINSDMAICDLSSKNPNVLYELGIRQSFDLPVTFIKDELTDRIFDIQGFRDTPYPSSLRIDEVEKAIQSISANIKETYENKGNDINSIVELLGISKADVKDPITLSGESTILLGALNEIQEKLNKLTQSKNPEKLPTSNLSQDRLGDEQENIILWNSDDYIKVTGDSLKVGDTVQHRKLGVGKVKSISIENEKVLTQFESRGGRAILVFLDNLKIKKNK